MHLWNERSIIFHGACFFNSTYRKMVGRMETVKVISHLIPSIPSVFYLPFFSGRLSSDGLRKAVLVWLGWGLSVFLYVFTPLLLVLPPMHRSDVKHFSIWSCAAR